MKELKELKHIHMIGIGGVGVSAIADILIDKGFKISGSDLRSSEITDRLSKKGACIYFEHKGENIHGCDLVVYTTAADSLNPELMEAEKLGIPAISRAQMLGELMKNYLKSVAVSGVHGKTTTTSMISLIYNDCGMDPTLLIGGDVSSLGGNARSGKGDTFITEACEYRDNFLEFYPTDLLVLNIDEDHKDYFKSLDQLIGSFIKFTKNVPAGGKIYANADDENVAVMVNSLEKDKYEVITFGTNTAAIYQATNLTFDDRGMPSFDVYHNDETLTNISLSVPGIHNVQNALAAFSVCHRNGLDPHMISQSLSAFTGAKRRFDILGKYKGATVVDDYAHHPTEVKATLSAAKKMPFNRVITVFQPHTYTRTRELLDEFSTSFSDSDITIVADIYAAREADMGDIHSKDLADKLNSKGSKSIYMGSFEDIKSYLEKEVKEGDIVFTMGAGDIFKIGYEIIKNS